LWEFNPHHRGGYLAGVGFFNRGQGVSLDDDEEEEGDYNDYLFQNGGVHALPAGMNLEV
jgi:hypothetical protein